MAHKFDSISDFILVVDENGFAAAARKKGVSTAAISRQVSALEQALGVQLLIRTTRQMTLTEIGEQYYKQCKKALVDLSDAEQLIMANTGELTGALHIMANRYFALTFLLPHLPKFQAQHRKLHIHLQLAERFPDFEKESVDLLFGISIDGPPDLVRKRIASTRYILCASPAYLTQYGMPKQPADLLKHSYITHSMRRQKDCITFKNGEEVRLHPTLFLNDSYAMRECALRGMGVVNLHDYMVEDAIKQGQLVEVLPNQQNEVTHIYLYFQQSRFLKPQIRQFIDFYMEKIK